MEQSTALGQAHVYTMRELNHRLSEIIQEINADGQPAVITRRGRFVALITPLATRGVESAVMHAVLRAAASDPSLASAESEGGPALSIEEAATELGLHVPGTDAPRALD